MIARSLTEREIIGQYYQKKPLDEIMKDVIRFGPLNSLMADEDVTEIMVNGPSQVYCERKGKIELTEVTFRDNDHIVKLIKKIAESFGSRINEHSPVVDVRLPDGSHLNAIVPPLAVIGPVLTIRKFAKTLLKLEDLIRLGTITEEIAFFLKTCVKAQFNIMVSGGIGSGKTTTLNVLSNFIPEDERIVTVEDIPEIQFSKRHVVSLISTQACKKVKKTSPFDSLIKNIETLRPDRIILGEVWDGAMLKVMNAGLSGVLATGCANSPGEMIDRLEMQAMLKSPDLSVKTIREQISDAIDIIIHQARLEDGFRKVVSITEVQGLAGEDIVLKEIFTNKMRFKRF